MLRSPAVLRIMGFRYICESEAGKKITEVKILQLSVLLNDGRLGTV